MPAPSFSFSPAIVKRNLVEKRYEEERKKEEEETLRNDENIFSR